MKVERKSESTLRKTEEEGEACAALPAELKVRTAALQEEEEGEQEEMQEEEEEEERCS